jgi:hypothetical protein
MASWLRVVEGDGDQPRVIDQGLDPGLVYGRPPELVAWGSVDGIPWRIQAAVTAPGPNTRWWEHGPIGPELVFMLGRDDEFGGGGVPTRLNEGTHLTASIDFFGSLPAIVSWVGVVSEDVARLEVRPDEGETREVRLHHGPAGFPRVFWFFPPRGAHGLVVAVAADGAELQSERLLHAQVHPRSNAGTAVNAFGHHADRPPPGWPDDPTVYAPGEGPRHAEDFHLHEATFPIYAIPPDRWDGHAGLAGSGSSGSDVTDVRFGYFDEPGGSERGLEIVNARPNRLQWARPVRQEDVGLWWSDRNPDDDVENFAARFLPRDGHAGLLGDDGYLELGPVRVAAIIELETGGVRVDAHRREFRRLPLLRAIGFELPGTRVTLLGWALSFEELEDYARSLERLELGTELFQSMQSAQDRSDSRFRELHGHHHDESD